jgi:RNA-directed DNA polymerase
VKTVNIFTGGSESRLQRKLKGIWRKHQGTPTRALIREMNPVIRGWSNYFRPQVASRTFRRLDDWMYYRAYHYAKRRHPKKSSRWRTHRYWGYGQDRQDRWVFMDKTQGSSLIKFAWVKIQRHAMVPSTYSPDDPTRQDYWRQRGMKTQTTGHRYRRLFANQKGLCPVCYQPLENGEEIHRHHVIPKKRGGTDALDNLRLVHLGCHRQIHSKSAPSGVRQLLEPCTG